MTALVHGESATREAIRASDVLFGGGLEGLSEGTFNELAAEIPGKTLEPSRLQGAGMPLVELLVHAGLCPSKGQARKDLEGGGINVNNVREPNAQRHLTSADCLFSRYLLLRKGKKTYVLITVG
jgi:tyrosyl-tRNA synthetase